MVQRFKAHIEKLLRGEPNIKFLVAVSGGVDSVVLVHLLRSCGYNFGIAHMNYKLRGPDSDLDQAFVCQLAAAQNVDFHVKEASLISNESGIQEKARDLRYSWFEELCTLYDYEKILTAHHADDQIETFFMRLSRGSGIEGLGGIRNVSGLLVRPLLPFFKSDLIAFAKAKNIAWREDASNASSKYLRNTIRHEIMPNFLKLSPQTASNSLKTMQHLREASVAISLEVDKIKSEWQRDDDVLIISLVAIKSLKPLNFWLHQLFSPFGFDAAEVHKLLHTHPGKKCESVTHQLIMERDHLALSPFSEKGEAEEHYLVHRTGIDAPIRLQLLSGGAIQKTPNVAIFNEEKLSFPLILRRWNKGDFFYPAGMKGKKKLSKFFKDEKMSTQEKKNQWVLCNKNDVIWIIKKRADRRYVSDDDSNSLQIKLL